MSDTSLSVEHLFNGLSTRQQHFNASTLQDISDSISVRENADFIKDIGFLPQALICLTRLC
jgi:hypothetical protein